MMQIMQMKPIKDYTCIRYQGWNLQKIEANKEQVVTQLLRKSL